MEGVRPCPYCGGEVEVVKLIRRADEKKDVYRIECRKCRSLVARGNKFPIESAIEGKSRIDDYNEFIKRTFDRGNHTRFPQDANAKRRDRAAARSSRIDKYDEEREIHDYSMSIGHNMSKRCSGVLYD